MNSAKIVQKGVDSACWRLCNLIEASYKDSVDCAKNINFYTNLIIIDEADRLKIQALEELRSIFDHGGVGLVLIGMPGMQKRLSRYPQLYSRVGFVHEFRTLSQDEMLFLVERHLTKQLELQDFTDKEALSAVMRITQGNFRLMIRLLEQIKRILEINKLQTITKEVVETRLVRTWLSDFSEGAKILVEMVPNFVESHSSNPRDIVATSYISGRKDTFSAFLILKVHRIPAYGAFDLHPQTVR